MPYQEAKVYCDGSHYIAIPHTTRKTKPRTTPPEEIIVVEEKDKRASESVPTAEPEATYEEASESKDLAVEQPKVSEPSKRSVTKKEYFEELYLQSQSMPKGMRKNYIKKEMLPYFETDEQAEEYVVKNLERKQRNLIARKVRMWRKINLQNFNYFCTFTYDSALHTEETFRRKLKNYLRNLCYRKGWKYIGVWERSPEKNRLHFHGIFYIPDGTMRELVPIEDYNLNTHKRQITYQNTDFNSRFGRSDFVAINSKLDLGEMMQYIIKYLEKTGEKLVYSKGLPQFFISDIMDKDVAAPIGIEDKKLLLFVARNKDIEEVYYNNYDKTLREGVHLGCISWENILQGLRGIKSDIHYEKLIINDLCRLLEQKGFDGFLGFKEDVEVDKNGYYRFWEKYT